MTTKGKKWGGQTREQEEEQKRKKKRKRRRKRSRRGRGIACSGKKTRTWNDKTEASVLLLDWGIANKETISGAFFSLSGARVLLPSTP